MHPDTLLTASKRKRREIIEWLWWKQDGRCIICGDPMLPHGLRSFPPERMYAAIIHPDAATIEHIVPKRDGGTNHLRNLALAHHRCNAEEGSRYEIERQERLRQCAAMRFILPTRDFVHVEFERGRAIAASPGYAELVGLVAHVVFDIAKARRWQIELVPDGTRLTVY